MKRLPGPVEAACLLLVALGTWDVLFVYEENRCSMTYMFESPEYLRIKLPKKIASKYPSYGLYLYGEGDYAEESKKLKVTGIPVLFLPGNAGSYKQVRSLGSVALRKAQNMYYKYHFDFFSVDFNEELVALYGGSLEKQTKFVRACTKVILNLYKSRKVPPHSVAIVGHSMGGIIARALFTLRNFDPTLISLIITQATPHIAPVLPLDSYLTDFYTAVNSYWILNEKDLRNVTILSVGGGFRDYQVRSGLTVVPSLDAYNHTLNVVTSAVPMAWLSTDHLCIVWCKELVLATIRAFFDLIDPRTHQITTDPSQRMSVLHNRFVSYSLKASKNKPESSVTISGSLSRWTEIKTNRWTYTSPQFSAQDPEAKYFLLPLPTEGESDNNLYCRNMNLDTSNWIYGCGKNKESVCQEGINLSGKSELLQMFKIVKLKLEEYRSFSHFVIHISTTSVNKQLSIECEFFSAASRMMSTPVVHILSFGVSASKVVINSTGLMYVVQLQEFNQIYQAFKIQVKRDCPLSKEKKADIYRFHVPWSHEDSVIMTSGPSFTVISAKLQRARPANDTSVPELQLHTSAGCQYKITIRTSVFEVLGQLFRFHGVYLPMYVVANILLAYGGQLFHLHNKGHCLDFNVVLKHSAKPYKVIPFVHLFVFLLRYDWFKDIWAVLSLPELDAVILTKQDIYFPLVSFLFFFFGTAIAYWSGILFHLLLKHASSFWSVFCRSLVITKEPKPRLLNLCSFSIKILLLFISWTTCGALALILTYFLYFFKVLSLQASLETLKGILNLAPMQEATKKTHLDSSTTKEARDSPAAEGLSKEKDHSNSAGDKFLSASAIDEASDTLQIHITVLHLLNWIILLSAPSFIYWLKNLRYSRRLDPDPYGSVAIIAVLTTGVLINSQAASVKKSKLLKHAARLQLLLPIPMAAFGLVHLYRVPYFVTCSLVLHALCCLG
ncbi:GPI inositol-deacylase isoform X2 [Callorhinchus milii]|uniref:GPI inositol-deacylase n=2 Tax=Callorhinchus milii TaxID=7868 RepID=V9K8G2_CALMI|nr:GPI inositol-deacylase isoform X2 [Callorhinchus milii]|eukprot:gi/632946067/ref/XP_007888374.1/ PREDICTED: GPI inositol-deacylase [Callorhinchus milii]